MLSIYNHMAKKSTLQVKDAVVKTLHQNGIDYICITDIARQKNPVEPKDVVKNWMRVKNTLEYLGIWEKLNNPNFKGVEFDPLLAEAGSTRKGACIYNRIDSADPYPLKSHLHLFHSDCRK